MLHLFYLRKKMHTAALLSFGIQGVSSAIIVIRFIFRPAMTQKLNIYYLLYIENRLQSKRYNHLLQRLKP